MDGLYLWLRQWRMQFPSNPFGNFDRNANFPAHSDGHCNRYSCSQRHADSNAGSGLRGPESGLWYLPRQYGVLSRHDVPVVRLFHAVPASDNQCYTHSDSNTDFNSHCNRYANPSFYSDAYPVANRYGHSHSDGNCNSNGHSRSG